MDDVEKNLEFELPKSEELVWINDKQFATVENNKYILINTIEGDTLNTQKYDIGNWIKDKEQVYNLQYIDNKLRFDAILLSKAGNYVLGIDELKTYEIQQ